ncbi:hypothetical protein QJQ08_00125 [Chlamydia suis]|uniref:hypothetical protein n=1 Tax=Chlamydia suis TaxID=83559 RepID=UPI002B3BC0B0|nr:hypothetical protein [Chlamydia suis]MEB2694229.1 hypothetical protein [Chlamydia suis]
MTRRPKAKQDEQGRFISNKAKQKAGLNKSILNVGWHVIETYTYYKAYSSSKAVFKIPAPTTVRSARNAVTLIPTIAKHKPCLFAVIVEILTMQITMHHWLSRSGQLT